MIKIPHNRAIQLLEATLLDVDKSGIDFDALKSRVQDDIIGIFGRGPIKILMQLDYLRFTLINQKK